MNAKPLYFDASLFSSSNNFPFVLQDYLVCQRHIRDLDGKLSRPLQTTYRNIIELLQYRQTRVRNPSPRQTTKNARSPPSDHHCLPGTCSRQPYPRRARDALLSGRVQHDTERGLWTPVNLDRFHRGSCQSALRTQRSGKSKSRNQFEILMIIIFSLAHHEQIYLDVARKLWKDGDCSAINAFVGQMQDHCRLHGCPTPSETFQSFLARRKRLSSFKKAQRTRVFTVYVEIPSSHQHLIHSERSRELYHWNPQPMRSIFGRNMKRVSARC